MVTNADDATNLVMDDTNVPDLEQLHILLQKLFPQEFNAPLQGVNINRTIPQLDIIVNGATAGGKLVVVREHELNVLSVES